MSARGPKRPSSHAAGESKPEAYPRGRTVRRIRSIKSVRADELVRGRVPVENFDEPRTTLADFLSRLLCPNNIRL